MPRPKHGLSSYLRFVLGFSLAFARKVCQFPSMSASKEKPLSRLQIKNRTTILDAALDVFSQHGFRGATLDMIAVAADMSKPNLIYYSRNKDEIFLTLLNQLMEQWLAPLRGINPNGDPIDEILTYVRRKVQMSRDMPRESRLFANEVVQGAPRMGPHLSGELKQLFDETKAIFQRWMDQGKLARCNPEHLIFSVWANTQHYADFEVQTVLLADPKTDIITEAEQFLVTLYTKLLTPSS